MNKKLLIAALALPLFAACSDEEQFIDSVKTESNKTVTTSGLPKVDATFVNADASDTRMATKWGLENDDLIGLAWMGAPATGAMCYDITSDITSFTADQKAAMSAYYKEWNGATRCYWAAIPKLGVNDDVDDLTKTNYYTVYAFKTSDFIVQNYKGEWWSSSDLTADPIVWSQETLTATDIAALDRPATGAYSFADNSKAISSTNVANIINGEYDLVSLASLSAGSLSDGTAFAAEIDNPSYGGTAVPVTGEAYQNHPLFAKNGGLEPLTSIYVGKYYGYYPYDDSTVNVAPIKFNLGKQPLENSYGNGDAGRQAIAKNGIFISDVWTDVTLEGNADGYNKAGRDHKFKLYLAQVSNVAALSLTYENNNPGVQNLPLSEIKEIVISIKDGSGAEKLIPGFTYKPTASPVADPEDHNPLYWRGKNAITDATMDAPATIKLKGRASTATPGLFAFNMLPVTGIKDFTGYKLDLTIKTTYGTVKGETKLADLGKATQSMRYNSENQEIGWRTTEAPDLVSFVNVFNTRGKFTVKKINFADVEMNGIHVESDEELMNVIKYFEYVHKDSEYETPKSGTDYQIYLDGDDNKEFRLSTETLAELRKVNTMTEKYLSIQPCHEDEDHVVPERLVLTGGGELPSFKQVFEEKVDGTGANINYAIYLASEDNWSWTSSDKLENEFVSAIINEGTLTMSANTVETKEACILANDGTINVTGGKVNVVNNLTNYGTINVGSATETSGVELRAVGTLVNDAWGLTPGMYGVINNYSVMGTQGGKLNNYAEINIMNATAYTFVSNNETAAHAFCNPFDKDSNKIGTINLPNGAPTAQVSVGNTANTGFIRYEMTPGSTSLPAAGNWNTLIVNTSNNSTAIAISGAHIHYVIVNGSHTMMTSSSTALEGLIINPGCSMYVKAGTEFKLNPTYGRIWMGDGATIYKGGTINPVKFTDYFGESGKDVVNYVD